MIDSLFAIGRGSNSWVIHGNHTVSGKPILANDPHLDNSMPSIWYPLSIYYGGDNHLFGVSNAGTPFVMIGHTRRVCWGITALLTDDSDLYSETLNSDQSQYWHDGKWLPTDVISEIIRVKGEDKPIVHEVRSTHHGPLITNILNKMFKRKTDNGKHYSFAWTGLMKHNAAIRTILSIYEAKNVYDMEKSLGKMGGLYLNVIFMDKQGNIGYIATGIHKIKNHEHHDFFPLNGTEKQADWQGYLPDNVKISIINPKKGYISTANNKFAGENIK